MKNKDFHEYKHNNKNNAKQKKISHGPICLYCMIKTQKTFNTQSIYLTKEKKQYKENGYRNFFCFCRRKVYGNL